MGEKNLDFDTVIDRSNTNSTKYNFSRKFGVKREVLPLWIADMDFRVSSYIQEAVTMQAEHGIYGYSEGRDGYFEAVRDWMLQHHGWEVHRKWLIKTPGVVYALAMAVKAFTDKGDGVLIQQPVYYPFRNVIEDNDRRVINNALVQDETGRYYMDYEDLERKIEAEKVRLMFLCNPHNPVGRVWTREELLQLGEICYRHGVIVASDEIHSDFIFQGEHQVFADLKEEFREITITCTSPSKTFNIAGMQMANIFISNAALKGAFRKQIRATGLNSVHAVGLAACEAAYRYGEEWYREMISYISENIAYIRRYLADHIPDVHMIETEGTYLVWLDFRKLGLSSEKLEELIVERAGLWLDKGTMFGPEGEGFQRMNTACPRSILKQAMEQLEQAVRDFTSASHKRNAE